MRILLALVAAILTTTACATNPVTGKRELSFMSEAQEISVGRELDAQVRQEMGLYEDDELQRYVQELGMRLARSSQRPNLPWSFAVLDSPAVNAFALPGGFIYITRGILPYLDNEAQLVGVLGHEIGHVTARHSAQQYTRGMGASLGVLVGSIFVPQIRPFGDLAEGGIGVLFLKFGRDDELQADALGAEYTAAGGWDPDEVPAVPDDARADRGDDRSQRRAELDVDASAARKSRRARDGDGEESADRGTERAVDSRSRRLSRAHRRHRLWRQPGRRRRARQHVSASAAALRDRVSRKGGRLPTATSRSSRRSRGTRCSWCCARSRRGSGRSLDQVAQQHMRESGYKATDLTSATIGGHAGGRRHLRRERVGHRQSDGARRARRPWPQHVLHRRHCAARRVSARRRATSIARFSRSGR